MDIYVQGIIVRLHVLFFNVNSIIICVFQALVEAAETSSEKYDKSTDHDLDTGLPDFKHEPLELIFKAGQSKRIWKELHKVNKTCLYYCRSG